MKRLTERAHELVRERVHPGDTAVDATCGNGYDTLFLAECVGPTGVVYGFDIQPRALKTTKDRLEQSGLSNVVLMERDHAQLEDALKNSGSADVAAVMFNLGYLPGGDKSQTTRTATTLQAIQSALTILRPAGIVTILAYTGHPGGQEEANRVREFLVSLPLSKFEVREEYQTTSSELAPRLFAIRSRNAVSDS